MRTLAAIDLFSGCGGLTLGLKQAGFRVIGAVEIDPVAVETYKANHNEVEVWEKDIRALKVSELKQKLNIDKGDLDLLAGCPPCQGFSTIRTLNGALPIEDSRNDLLFEFIRFVKGLRPKTVMLENVPGLAVDHRFSSFLKQMSKMGYIGEHRILNAADYGVPQRRKRLIYLAGLGTSIPFAEPTIAKKTVRDAIGFLTRANESGDPIHNLPENRTPRIMEMIKHIPKNGGSRTDVPEYYTLKCHRRCNGFKDVYGRMAWDDVAPTITSGCFNPSKGRYLHPDEDRAISMREAALLQSFPVAYQFPGSMGKSITALMIGNALPPEFVRHHAKVIAEALLSHRDHLT